MNQPRIIWVNISYELYKSNQENDVHQNSAYVPSHHIVRILMWCTGAPLWQKNLEITLQIDIWELIVIQCNSISVLQRLEKVVKHQYVCPSCPIIWTYGKALIETQATIQRHDTYTSLRPDVMTTPTCLSSCIFMGRWNTQDIVMGINSLWTVYDVDLIKLVGFMWPAHLCPYLNGDLLTQPLHLWNGWLHRRVLCSCSYRKTLNISRTSVGNKTVDNSDVVGASPVGAAPTTSSFST